MTAALPLTNQLQESCEATPDGIWGRTEMLDPSLVWPHSKGEASLCILHCHNTAPTENSGKERGERNLRRERGREEGREREGKRKGRGKGEGGGR